MKIKSTATILFFILLCANSYAQLSTLINNFKIAYSRGDVDNYISEGTTLVSNLRPEEKAKGQRILKLFKVLTGNEQDMSIIDFNHAMNAVGISSLIEKNINSDLSLISIKAGAYRSYLVFNQSKKSYKFSLKGLFKTGTKTATSSFDGGVYDYHCRIVNYTVTPYNYTVVSVTEIPLF